MSSRTCRTVENPLVGLWFHSLGKKGIEWQGQVIEYLGHSMYRVQLYEWLVGSESDEEIVSATRIKKWLFYATNRAMRDAWERFHRARQDAEVSRELDRFQARRAKVSPSTPSTAVN
jgi:hypothetical protein